MSIKKECTSEQSTFLTEDASKKLRDTIGFPVARGRTASVRQSPPMQVHDPSTIKSMVYDAVSSAGSEYQPLNLSNWYSPSDCSLSDLDDEGYEAEALPSKTGEVPDKTEAAPNETEAIPQAIEDLQCDLLKTCMEVYRNWCEDFKNLETSCAEAVYYLKRFIFLYKLRGAELNIVAVNRRIRALILMEIKKLHRLISEDNFILTRLKDAFPETDNRLNEIEKIIPLSVGLRHPFLLLHVKQATTITERISLNSKTLEHLKYVAKKKHPKTRRGRLGNIVNLNTGSETFTQKPLYEHKRIPQFSLYHNETDKLLMEYIDRLPSWVLNQKYSALCEEANSLLSKVSSHSATLHEITEAEVKLCERKRKLISEITMISNHGMDISTDLDTTDGRSSGHESSLLSSDYFAEAFNVPDSVNEIINFTNKLKWCIAGGLTEPMQDILSAKTASTSYLRGREYRHNDPEYEERICSEDYSFSNTNVLVGRIFRHIADEMINELDPSRLWLPDKLLEIESRLLKLNSTKLENNRLVKVMRLLVSGSTMITELEPSIRERNLLITSLLSDDLAMLSQVQGQFPETEHNLAQIWSSFALNGFHSDLLQVLETELQHPLSGQRTTVSGRILITLELLKRLKRVPPDEEALKYYRGNLKLNPAKDSVATATKEEHIREKQKMGNHLAEALLLTVKDCESVRVISWLLDELCHRIYMWNAKICEKIVLSGHIRVRCYQSMHSAFMERENSCSLLLNHFSNLLNLRQVLLENGQDTNQTIDEVKGTSCSNAISSKIWLLDDGSLETRFYPMTLPRKISSRIEFCEKLMMCIIGDIAPNESLVEYSDVLKLPETEILTLDGKALINPIKERVKYSSEKEPKLVRSNLDAGISQSEPISKWYHNRRLLFDLTDYRILYHETRLGLRPIRPD